jgi:predicted  nucleic acid-binding Zn-ribbon protein
MTKPWTDEDLKHLGVFAPCPKCGMRYTRYHRKKEIEAENKKLKKQ